MTTGPATRILIMADTHNRLPPKVLALAEKVNEIWHLGDVCAPPILDELRLLGPPVTVVRGNCDSNFEWPLTIDLTRNGIRFRLQHIPPPPRQTPTNCDVLFHGHTHLPRDETIGSVRFLNPGCVTRPNRGSPPSVAFIEFTQPSDFEWRLVRLR
jgi:putative phosphoesterase